MLAATIAMLIPLRKININGPIKKLRGIVVSGATTKDKADPVTLSIGDRALLHQMIQNATAKYGWDLFPLNQPKVNYFLFDERNIIYDASSCKVSRRVESLNFNGDKVDKCVLRDETLCEPAFVTSQV